MKYQTEDIRRKDHLMDEHRALELLRQCEYGILSMTGDDGLPYGIPVNYVWDGQESLYVHCAPEGKKLRSISLHPEVSFCVIGKVHLLPDKFSTERESVVLKGTAHIGLSAEEKLHALHLLVDKLSPDFQEAGYRYAEKALHRVEIIRIDCQAFAGKSKVLNTNM